MAECLRTMRIGGLVALVASCLLWTGAVTAEARPLPTSFFGIVPQTNLSPADTALMRSGRIGALRTPVDWSREEPTPGDYRWGGLNHSVAEAARAGIEVLPFVYGTPGWLSPEPTNLPVANGTQRRAWMDFLRAAVRRFGPGGSFWAEHPELPQVPIRRWQVWNEPNFHYFTTPVSPRRYAIALRDAARAVKSVDRGAQVLIGGLFGRPRGRPPRAMPAARFLAALYRVRGIKRFFDGVALHPYAAGVGRLVKISQAVRRVIVRNRDRRTGLYITEMGWGSERNQRKVAFEVGLRGQARVLRNAYRYLIGSRRRLNLKQVYWFSWKDAEGACAFCDSVGLFYGGDGFRAKPAWHTFRRLARTPARRFDPRRGRKRAPRRGHRVRRGRRSATTPAQGARRVRNARRDPYGGA